MKNMTVLELIPAYKQYVEDGSIQFLKKGSRDQKDVLAHLSALHAAFLDARKKQDKAKTEHKEKKDISELLDWNSAHESGRALWQTLASSALRHIDGESKGNSRLFEFVEAATDFEDLLYGLEPYYRDHTLHSLWVYFIGETLLRGPLSAIHASLDWHIVNDLERDKATYDTDKRKPLLAEAKRVQGELCSEVNKKTDSIWCLMALCHDLGYSVSKIPQLNDRVKNVLRFFEMPEFCRIGYSFDVEHQYIASQFLELMAMDVRILPSEDCDDQNINVKERIQIKCYRDDSTYWRLCRALEKKQHGILSSYLIYKVLGVFADTWVRGPSESWGLEYTEAIDNVIRGEILFAIAQHTFDFAYLKGLNSLADILVLADELEEFSRYGRQLLSRKYHDTTARAAIEFKPANPHPGEDVRLNITYEVLRKSDFHHFAAHKSRQLCTLYSLNKKSKKTDSSELSTISDIQLTTKCKRAKVVFTLRRDKSSHLADLPGAEIDGTEYPAKQYEAICRDDELYIQYGRGKEKTMREWLACSKSVSKKKSAKK